MLFSFNLHIPIINKQRINFKHKIVWSVHHRRVYRSRLYQSFLIYSQVNMTVNIIAYYWNDINEDIQVAIDAHYDRYCD